MPPTLTLPIASSPAPVAPGQPYGDLTVLNTERMILDSVGKEFLTDTVNDYLCLLDSSAAIYEKNGDYALGLFSSGWCRLMDAASHRCCGTTDNREALGSGQWHCHESCWQTSKASIDNGQPVDRPCLGGIRIHAVPIWASGEIIGSINVGYSDPPKDQAKLEELAVRYGLTVDALREQAAAYESRPQMMLDIVKSRLVTAAKLIGALVERKLVEKQLQDTAAELARSNAELEQFAYVASHDLQEPLRKIIGYSQLLEKRYKGQLDADADDFIGFLVDGATRMRTLIQDLLAYSRVNRRGKEFEAVSGEELLQLALSNLRGALEDSGGQVTVDPLPTVWADRGQVVQVFQNLIGNALKFHGAQPPRVHVGVQSQGQEWMFSVRDNGIGIDPQDADRIFQIFQRLHDKTEYPGTGIGLAICKKVIERHGGRIWIESQPGQGTTFFFTLPKPEEQQRP